MSKFKEVVGQVGVYTSAFALTQFVSVVGAVLVRYFLGPVQTGVWSLVQVILSYTDYANLGTTYAIPIEIPFKRGQGKIEEADKMKNTMLSFSFLTSLLFSAAVLIYAFFRRSQIPAELFYGLLIAAVIVILQQMNNVLISLLRAFKNFKLAGRQMFLSSIVNLALVVSLSSIFKLYGFMLAMCVSFVFNIVFILCHESFDYKWTLNFKILKGLIQYGLPLMVLTLVGTILLTIDKIMIARYLGLEALGLYSIAVMTTGFICSVPNSIGVVLLPNISEKYADGESAHNLRGYLVKSNHVFATTMPLLIGFSWFVVPLMIHFLIPKFSPGIDTLKFLTLSTFFIGLTQAYTNCVVITKRHFWQFPITLSVCLMAFVSMYLAIKKGAGVNGVALIMTIVMMVNFSALYFFVSRTIFEFRELWSEYFKVLSHFIFMTIVLLALDSAFSFLPVFVKAVAQCFALLLLYAPFIWHINKQYGIWLIFREKIFKSKKIPSGAA